MATDWRMVGILKDIGVIMPRNGTMEVREARAKQFLEHVKKDGVPPVQQKK